MHLILYIIICAIIIITIYGAKSSKLNIIVSLLCTIFILEIVIMPQLCISAAITGAKLFFYKVFPSLFPFLIISNLMINFGGVQIFSKVFGNILCKPLRIKKECSFVILISFICGYPLGAKYTCDFYEKGIIDLETCQRLLNIASNASPLFIVGSIGASMMKDMKLAYIMLASNCISSYMMGLILPIKSKAKAERSINVVHYEERKNIGVLFKQIIDNSISTCLSIFGYVVIFSVITQFIIKSAGFYIVVNKLASVFNISQGLLSGLLLGTIEMTNGCNLIALSQGSLPIKAATISFLLSFSGISIITQVYSFTYKYRVSMKKYIYRKLIQGSLSAVLTLLLLIIP